MELKGALFANSKLKLCALWINAQYQCQQRLPQQNPLWALLQQWFLVCFWESKADFLPGWSSHVWISQDEAQAQHNKSREVMKISEHFLSVHNVCVRWEANTLQRSSTQTVPALAWRPRVALSLHLAFPEPEAAPLQQMLPWAESPLLLLLLLLWFSWGGHSGALLIAIPSVPHSVQLCTSTISFHLLFWTFLTFFIKRWPGRILLWVESERLGQDRDADGYQVPLCSGKTQIFGF